MTCAHYTRADVKTGVEGDVTPLVRNVEQSLQ